MKQRDIPENQKEMAILCNAARELIGQKQYRECELMIRDAMTKYPHAPEPHNLIGILLESEGDHPAAMKHFRAAWALDPTYIPARCNMERFAGFCSAGQYAFDPTDCPIEKKDLFKTVYDENGIGHIVKRD